jgi:hypothetical protein
MLRCVIALEPSQKKIIYNYRKKRAQKFGEQLLNEQKMIIDPL